MASSTRIKGTQLTLTIGGVDYAMDVTAITLENEESAAGVTTFEDAAAGGARQFYFTGTAIQSTDEDSFWTELWEQATRTGISYVYAPWGNETPTADQPHFTGDDLELGPKPFIGGEAGADNEFTFEFRFDLGSEPTKEVA
jgi:hypothetical protein